MGYIYQHPDFGLGNFINLTPAIAWLHHTTGVKVPVYFSTEYVRQCFLDWEAITIIYEKPDTDPLFGSNLVNPSNDMPDYKFVFERITGEEWNPRWHTYVDRPQSILEYTMDLVPHVVLICGSGSENKKYFAGKNPGEEAYKNCIHVNAGRMKIVAVGSHADAERSPWLTNADHHYFGDIRSALKLISYAKLVISNDCGLAHAAGAMNKPLQILWKDTPRERCKNPGTHTQYIYL